MVEDIFDLLNSFYLLMTKGYNPFHLVYASNLYPLSNESQTMM